MGDLRPFPPARLSPVLGMGDLYLSAFPPARFPRCWVWAICARRAGWLGSISMSFYGGDPMAARSALPGSGLGRGDLRPFAPGPSSVWAIRPARCPDALRASPFSLFSPFSHTNSHFCPFWPIFADFCPFQAAGGGGGAASKVCSFFHSLRRRARERRGGALKVIAYTLYAMPNSPPCVMPSGMALFLCPARCARSRWKKTCG